VRLYLTQVRETLRDLSTTVSRAATLVLVLVVLFELVLRHPDSELSFGSLALRRSDLLLACWPPLIAYLLLDTVLLSARYERTYTLHSCVYKVWNAKAEQYDLDAYVEPPLPLFWSAGGGRRESLKTSGERAEEKIRITLLGLVSLGALAYQIRMFLDHLRGAPCVERVGLDQPAGDVRARRRAHLVRGRVRTRVT